MSWNIKTPGDYINGPLTVAGDVTVHTNKLVVTSTGVGAGTTFPQAPFEIAAAASAKAKALQFSTVGSPYYGWIIAVDGAVNGNMILQSNNNNTIADVIEIARANGNVGFGLAPSYKLDVKGAARIGDDTTYNIRTGAYSAEAYLVANGSVPYVFYVGGAERARLNTTGAFVLGGGAIGANGVGIAFPAAQSASTDANTLDDYEEGTWTATVKGSTTDPTTPVTAVGRYTKVGRQVTVQLYVSNKTTTGASGRIQIAGLPFANNSSDEIVSSVGFFGMATFTGSPFGLTSQAGTAVDMWSSISNGAFQPVNHNPGTGMYMWLNITYTV